MLENRRQRLWAIGWVAGFVLFTSAAAAELTQAQKKAILRYGYSHLASHFSEIEPKAPPAAPTVYSRLFVSLYSPAGLVGCQSGSSRSGTGRLAADLREAITECVRDTRFRRRLTMENWRQAQLVIHVLHSWRQLENTSTRSLESALEPGIHSLRVRQGGLGAYYLATVPLEHGWPVGTMFQRLCRKAGINNAYLKTSVYRYKTISFSGTPKGEVWDLIRGRHWLPVQAVTPALLEKRIRLLNTYLTSLGATSGVTPVPPAGPCAAPATAQIQSSAYDDLIGGVPQSRPTANATCRYLIDLSFACARAEARGDESALRDLAEAMRIGTRFVLLHQVVPETALIMPGGRRRVGAFQKAPTDWGGRLEDSRLALSALSAVAASGILAKPEPVTSPQPQMEVQIRHRPQPVEVGRDTEVWMSLVNTGAASLRTEKAFCGLHVEVENARVVEVLASSPFTRAGESRIRSEAGRDWFESTYTSLRKGAKGALRMRIVPTALPVRIHYRAWIPAFVPKRRRAEAVARLVSGYEKHGWWRHETFLRRLPRNEDESASFCKIDVLAAHPEKQRYRCLLYEFPK